VSILIYLFFFVFVVAVVFEKRCLFRCQKLVAARKQMSILQAPNVLVIQLKVGFNFP
jgi:ubiquitin C-terminal hydrolase